MANVIPPTLVNGHSSWPLKQRRFPAKQLHSTGRKNSNRPNVVVCERNISMRVHRHPKWKNTTVTYLSQQASFTIENLQAAAGPKTFRHYDVFVGECYIVWLIKKWWIVISTVCNLPD